jgi:hypothetical protein
MELRQPIAGLCLVASRLQGDNQGFAAAFCRHLRRNPLRSGEPTDDIDIVDERIRDGDLAGGTSQLLFFREFYAWVGIPTTFTCPEFEV